MSLVIAFNLDRYAILATDRRGVIKYSDTKKHITLNINDHYQKIRKVPFGFFAAAGDYFITTCFYAECMRKMPKKRNLEELLQDTYHRYCDMKGILHFSGITTILLIANHRTAGKNFEKDAILEINISYENIEIQEIETMNLVALMANMNPDIHFWDSVSELLRPSNHFLGIDQFLSYHLNLIHYIWQEQLKFDHLISHHIDFYFHDRMTSKGIFIPYEKFTNISEDLVKKL